MRSLVGLAAALLFAAPSAASQDRTYHFGAAPERTNVTFESKTDVMTIVGTTHAIRGEARIDRESGTGETRLVVPVATLNTGLPARDRVLRMKSWLDEKTFPEIEFRASKATLEPPHTWSVEGALTLHGATRPLSIRAEVREIPASLAEKANLGPGDWIRVRTRFEALLSDFGVEIPQSSIAQVSDEWRVTVEIFGTTEPPAGRPAPRAPDDDAPDPTFATREIVLERAEGKVFRFGVKPQLTQVAASCGSDAGTLWASTVTMSGLVAIDLEKGTAKAKASIPVASLSTGIDRVDAALRAILADPEHPFVDLEVARAAPGDEGVLRVEGAITLKGRSRPLPPNWAVRVREIPAEVAEQQRWGKRPGLRFEGALTLRLSEFDLRVVEGVGDEWKVEFDVVALLEE